LFASEPIVIPKNRCMDNAQLPRHEHG
jgi:hypothetical protein